MLEPALPPLSEWENFYVITGSSAAALTGLMFVVVALRTDAKLEEAESGVRAFGSPNVVHFCAVLLLASILSIPSQTTWSLALCVSATGIAGLVLSGWVLLQARRQHIYEPVLSDWIWHVVLPLVAYAALVGAAVALYHRPAPALDLVAAVSLLLLFIGIHNAWDSAVWIAARRV
ncbi:hypothetical protein [Anaeromyxobacter oryzae]|uniref:Uncharacterized protein n=1 Tax=Anaeromyxobacter oryzae TaxID=2918170 RepID=A0ABM7WPT9_9BACT|nr:hypothetical protein [Anaeromyxobacter oryzae]BDG01477.1 hypothetical protein AMOR_04730 [Anaeromyxobacter oryzae]